MTNYEEEQSSEIEVLESIYEDDFQVVSTFPSSFTIPVRTADYEEGSESGLFVLLKFTHTKQYPDEVPLVEIAESENIEEFDLTDELTEFLNQQMEENLGMVMIFTVVSAAIEWLGSKWEELKANMADIAARKKEQEDEELKKKLEGTRVTVESFWEWKTEFDAERQLAKAKASSARAVAAAAAAAAAAGKLTGKAMFLADAELNDSDIKFLEAAGETVHVQVDESLFEDLDDLDLDDDDLDDPDWNPGDVSD